MKKILLFFVSVCIFIPTASAFLLSDDFLGKLSKCTPVNNEGQITVDGVIYGVKNQKCHVSFKGTLVNEAGEEINRQNCYIPVSELGQFASASQKISYLTKKYIKNASESSITPAQEEEFKITTKKLYYMYKRYCR